MNDPIRAALERLVGVVQQDRESHYDTMTLIAMADPIGEALDAARAALAQPAPVAEGEVAELVVWLRTHLAVALECGDTKFIVNACKICDLLKRLSPPQPIPVSERLPGPEECLDEGWAWFFNPRTGWRQATQPVHSTYTHWLPAHALPLPTHTSEND